MRSSAFLLFVIAIGFAMILSGPAGATAPVPKHLMKEVENTEQAKLQGKWKLESLSLGEMNLGAAAGIEMTLEVSADKLTVRTQDQIITAAIKLDVVDGVKRFATINTQKLGKDGKPAGQEADVVFGYMIEADKLTIAAQSDLNGGKTTPVDPKKPGSNGIVMVLTRVKDKN